MNKPRVSIIMPAFNAERSISFSIKSVLDQSFGEWELLIINDGSTDSTLDVILEFRDSRIKIINQSNQGVAAARNSALKIAIGEYIAFLDADDLWLPSKLQKQISIFSKSQKDLGLVYSGYRGFKFSEANSFSLLTEPINIHNNDHYKLLVSNYIATLTVMIRRDIVFDVGYFREDLRGTEDWDYWIRISKLYKLKKIDQELALYRISAGSLSSNKITHANEELKVLKTHLLVEDGIPSNIIHMAYLFWSIKAMKYQLLTCRFKYFLRSLLSILMLNNFYLRNYFILLLWIIRHSYTRNLSKIHPSNFFQ